jgi:protein-tyrosine phosphatase
MTRLARTALFLFSVVAAAPAAARPPPSLPAVPAVAARGLGGWIAGAWSRVQDAVVNVSGRTIGYLELYTSFRYSVTPYTAQVSPVLIRGSRRDPEELAELARRGVRGIISLTAERSDDRRTVERLGMRYLNLRIIDNTAPTRRQMKRMLDFLSESGRDAPLPAFVHCQAGKGRTGVAVAVYRMAMEGWTVEQAIAEGREFGLRVPAQIAFVRAYGQALAQGRIAGYPPRRRPPSAEAGR